MILIFGTDYLKPSIRIIADVFGIGIKAFLMKTLEKENLLQTVRKVLDNNL